jgi:signal transduction histidine kinase
MIAEALTMYSHPAYRYHPDGNLPSQTVGSESMIAAIAQSVKLPVDAIKTAVSHLTEKYHEDNAIALFLKIAMEEIDRIDFLIDECLDASEEQDGLDEVDVNEMIKKIMALIFFQARSNNIAINCHYGAIPRVKIHLFEMSQAIHNLINNALHVMPGGGMLSVKTKTSIVLGKTYIQICISDTGPGMPLLNEPKNHPATEKDKGFGLLITREIIERHGGFIKIDTRKDCGTHIFLYLPLSNKP